MKKALHVSAYVLFFVCAGFSSLQAQTCNVFDLKLNSQAAVNDFNSSCKTVKGDITINGADITDLSPLQNIETIEGKLTIQNNSSLPNLKGLEKLTSVQHLLLYTNDLLTDLSGLEGLKVVSGISHIRFHSKLTSLKGLDNLSTVNSLYVSNNDLLLNLSGLGSLETVTDLLSISVSKKLTSLTGLTKLTSVRRIIVGENDILTDLTGLETLQSVTYQMHITLNKSLLSLNGLSNLSYLSEVYITSNDVLPSLSGLETVGSVSWIVVGENKKLTSLTGLNNLAFATNMIIRANALLTSLSGLDNLTNIGWLQISGNAELLSLSGLGSSSSDGRIGANERVSATLALGGLNITNNPKLTTCAIEPVCSFIAGGTATISGNGNGCNSQSEIATTCGSLPVELVSFKAVAENSTTLLQWSTAEEHKSAVFEIEHSLNGKTWQLAGEHAAKGESTGLVEYQWIHKTPAIELNYYRLKMIDLDGTYAYSRIEKVAFEKNNRVAGLIYPNPVSDKLSIGGKDEVVLVRIVDLRGRTVYETTKVAAEGFSVKGMAAGLYQVQVTAKSGTVYSERVMIY
ncbi:T9SS type A sorting domain-containing protein [Dyadobacter sp. CY261]|uniref:T9SS type A sorting domain-containing protein n=1 Tax=Dyadobacter sp. CY261 TaxID=2907203 RepID=UPI001F187250|nr:T9SS type A sorting domain-containing protein [Dyadobacter sp. CY261]MCF0075386.1 T9SS type A sorting domain-containing protein [Dyadobacter sp. CY261]